MNIMMKLIKGFFIVLGVIFALLIAGGTYLYVADPFGFKPIVNSFLESPAGTTEVPRNDDGSIDREAAAESISAEQEACFYSALGEERANEIRAGADPTPTDFFKARHCIE